MIKDNQKKFNKIHVLMDACIIVISFLLAYYLKYYCLRNVVFQMGNNEKWYTLDGYTEKLILLVPLFLFLYYFLDLYTPKYNKHRLTQVFQIILANILGIVLFLFALYLQKENNISRIFLILFVVINIVLGICSRMLYSYGLKIMHKKQQLTS